MSRYNSLMKLYVLTGYAEDLKSFLGRKEAEIWSERVAYYEVGMIGVKMPIGGYGWIRVDGWQESGTPHGSVEVAKIIPSSGTLIHGEPIREKLRWEIADIIRHYIERGLTSRVYHIV